LPSHVRGRRTFDVIGVVVVGVVGDGDVFEKSST
jgi:hypothetical protein